MKDTHILIQNSQNLINFTILIKNPTSNFEIG